MASRNERPLLLVLFLAAACDDGKETGDSSAPPPIESVWYQDADGDGYGDPDSGTSSASAPEGWVEDATDCDDGDASIHPGAAESCNGLDDDCDGEIDEDLATTWYEDADGDGYGDADSALEDCQAPSGYVADDTDCDDGDASVSPGAEELCNGIDDDCDDEVDEDAQSEWFQDADGDGYGAAGASVMACEEPKGYADNADDCDDTDAEVTTGETWYADVDGDGFGDPQAPTIACQAPAGHVTDSSDCDDSDDDIHPEGIDYCGNGVDENCDGADNTCPAAGEILITELMANPAVATDSTGEWFELYNASSTTYDIQGLLFYDEDSDDEVITPSWLLKPGAYVVRGVDAATVIEVDIQYGSTTLANSGDEIYLAVYHSGLIIDQVIYESADVSEGISFSLDPSCYTGGIGCDTWCESSSSYSIETGTPGWENDGC